MRIMRLIVLVGAWAAMMVFAGPVLAIELPPAPPGAFEASTGCGCHAEFRDQWSRSMHAQSATDPLYRYKLAKANEQTGGAIGGFCETCHSPAAAMWGELGRDLSELSPAALEGVTCDVCHQITGHTVPVGNVSLEWTPDGTKRGGLTDSYSPVHATEFSEVHTRAELCGSCHQVMHPVNGLILEGTYTEWLNGPYADEGITCQDCHMTPGPGVTKPNPGRVAPGAPEREHIYIMTFAGGNVGLGDAVLAEERLQAAAEMEVLGPDVVAPGETASVGVRITNVGAGHYLPTGLTDVRRMWVELVATGPDGEPFEVGRREFHTVFHDAEGNSPAEIWFAEGVESDDRIPPRESVEQMWDVTMPDGPLELSATLYYRSAPEEMAEAAGVDIPTTTMTQASGTVFTSAEDAAAGARSAELADEGIDPLLLVAIIVTLVAVAGAGAYFFTRSRRA